MGGWRRGYSTLSAIRILFHSFNHLHNLLVLKLPFADDLIYPPKSHAASTVSLMQAPRFADLLSVRDFPV